MQLTQDAKEPVNFYVFHEIDKQGAKHALSFENCRKEGARGDADDHSMGSTWGGERVRAHFPSAAESQAKKMSR